MRLARVIEGVTLNGKEYVLSDDGEIFEFPTEADALGWLAAQGILVHSADELMSEYGITLEENTDEVPT